MRTPGVDIIASIWAGVLNGSLTSGFEGSESVHI